MYDNSVLTVIDGVLNEGGAVGDCFTTSGALDTVEDLPMSRQGDFFRKLLMAQTTLKI